MRDWLNTELVTAVAELAKATAAEVANDYDDALSSMNRVYWEAYTDALSAAAIEHHREFWANIARANGWYQTPFYVQVWFGPDGAVHDSVASRGMSGDVVLHLTEDDLEDEDN